MTKNRIMALCVLLLTICVFVEAQTQRNNRRNTSRTTRVQKKTELEKKDTVALAPKKEEPKYKSLSDPMVLRYLHSGFAKEKKLYLMTNSDYAVLPEVQKQEVLGKVAQDFFGYDMMLYTGSQQRELWIANGNGVKCIEKWNNATFFIKV